jgi:predicted ATPase with chaperone activity
VSLISVRNLPAKPASIPETGLTIKYLVDLALKTMYVRGLTMGDEIADAIRLPFEGVTDKLLDSLRLERLIEVSGSAGIGRSLYRYAVSQKGRERARELMDQNEYVGPAPVTLEAYTQMVNAQTLADKVVTRDDLKRVLSHLVLGDQIFNQLGPAINSRRSIFLFGSTGNGKTSIGLAIGTMLSGAIWIPYAVSVEGQIIKLFDALHHRAISEINPDEAATERSGLLSHLSRARTSGDVVPTLAARSEPRYDRRWVRIHRPLIISGGELTLKNFSLVLDPTTRYYEAPQQMKANGGVFLIDDLGRQPVSPREILNRWIVPLEKQVDYLTMASGFKFQIPFDALLLFATNLNPEQVADEVILRRIRNQVHIPDPTWAEFREIFRREANNRTIPYSDDCLQHVITEYYVKLKRRPRGVHPRDLLDELMDVAHFQGVPPTMSKELMDLACRSYFLV